ncbi:MAG TPA: dihydrolipoamide acetyltransferase family protein [Ktedonobacteraceae bacterium]|nr:dihydrolipoamide acetyltransferase family protein [Ktedonobacteraceae bacterium]
MSELKLADLGEGMHEAEVVEWLVKVGDTVKLDQTVVKVETDKAIVEIPAPVAGRVSEIRVSNGQTARVGDVLVVFDAPSSTNGDSTASARGANTTATMAQATTPASPVASTTQAPAPKPRVLAAPAVRKLAFELGIDLEQVTPSNANGRVSLEDVKALAENVKSAPIASPAPVGTRFIASEPPASETEQQSIPQAQDERQPLTGLRKRIAEHMERSWRTIPHATAFSEVDASGLVALREALKPVAEKRGIRLTYMPLLIKLLIPLLKEFPIFNASLDDERREIVYKRSYHIGVATATHEGLLVPVLRNADRLTLLDIAANVDRLIEGAKQRTLTLPEVSGSTFTLNNVGSFGGSTGTPIINHPEVAILAFGRIEDKAIVERGTVIVRPMMPLALSFDHRLIDGASSGAFMGRFKELVENPQQLMLDMI